MERSVTFQVRDLPPEKRHAAEVLLGEALNDDELLSVQAYKSRVIKEAATGEEREQAFKAWSEFSDRMAKHAEGVPDEEIDAVIDEACDYVRHHPE